MDGDPRRLRTATAGVRRNNALDSAFRILARRDHTRKELSVKLRARGFGHDDIVQALARCGELGYLDDARTAKRIADHMAARGYGPLRVRQALLQKGLDENLVRQALDCCGDEAQQVCSARRMLEKKTARLSRETDAWKRRQAAYRYLSGRGFSSAVIDRAIVDV